MKKLFLVAALGVAGIMSANNGAEKETTEIKKEAKKEAKDISAKKRRNISLTIVTWCGEVYHTDSFSIPEGGGFGNTGLTEAEWAQIGQAINIAMCGSPADEIEVGGN